MFNRTYRAAFAAFFIALTALCGAHLALADPLDNVFTRITDSNGRSVSGGKVYVFTCGTTTPVTTYAVSSSAGVLSSAQAHPVVADSGGKIAAMFVPAGCYKIRYTNSAGTTLYEVDNYILKDIDALNANNFPVAAKTDDYTVTSSDDGAIIAMDASAASPKAISAASQALGNGFPFCVVNSGATGTVTVTPDVGETINGASSYSLATQYQSACFVSRGAAGWFIWAERDPAGTFNTASTFNETVTFNDDIVAPPVTLTDAATIDWDMSTGSNFTVTLGGNRTLAAPTGETAGQTGRLIVVEDGTGARTLTWNAAYKFDGALSMRPDQTASATTVYSFYVRGADDVIMKRLFTSAYNSIGFYKEYDLGVFNDNANTTQAHGLGRLPALVQTYIENTSADQGYSSGDRVILGAGGGEAASASGCNTTVNTTNVIFTCNDAFRVVDRVAFTNDVITEANWKVYVRIFE